MNFEQTIKANIERGIKDELKEIMDKHIFLAVEEMRSKSNGIIASLGLKFMQRVSYQDNMNHIRVELSIPNLIDDTKEKQ